MEEVPKPLPSTSEEDRQRQLAITANTTKSITRSMWDECVSLKKKMLSLVELVVVAGLLVSSNWWLNALGNFYKETWGEIIMNSLLLCIFSILGIETRANVLEKIKNKDK